MKSKTKEKDTAKDQAKAQLESIKELVAQLKQSRDTDHPAWNTESEDVALEIINQDPLCVEIRSNWHTPGEDVKDAEADGDFSILLCTGGPAVRIIGSLSMSEPENAKLEYQDWGTPWTEYRISGEEEDILLTYARCFYFGQ
jgi:hypothetical protein